MKTLSLLFTALFICLCSLGQDVQTGSLRLNYWTTTPEVVVSNTIGSLSSNMAISVAGKIGNLPSNIITNKYVPDLILGGSIYLDSGIVQASVFENSSNSFSSDTGNYTNSLNLGQGTISDSKSILSVFYSGRQLVDSIGDASVDWDNRNLNTGGFSHGTDEETMIDWSVTNGVSFPFGIVKANGSGITNVPFNNIVGLTNIFIQLTNGNATGLILHSNVTLGVFPWLRFSTNVVGIQGAGTLSAKGTYIQTIDGVWTNISGNGSAVVFLNPTYLLQTNNVSLYSVSNLFYNSTWLNVIGTTAVPTNSGFGFIDNHAGIWDTNVWASSLTGHGMLPMDVLDTTRVVTNNANASLNNVSVGNFTVFGNQTNNGNLRAAGFIGGLFTGNGTGLTNITVTATNVSYNALTNSAAVTTNDSRSLFFTGLFTATYPTFVDQGSGAVTISNTTGDLVNIDLTSGEMDFVDANSTLSGGYVFDEQLIGSAGILSGGGIRDVSASGYTQTSSGNIQIQGTGQFIGNAFGITNIPASAIRTNGSSNGQVLTSQNGVTLWTNAVGGTAQNTNNVTLTGLTTLTNQQAAGVFYGTGTNFSIVTYSTNASGALLTNYVMIGNNLTGNIIRFVGTNSTTLAKLDQLGNLTIAGQYLGDASALTNMNASQLTSGTVALGLISTNVVTNIVAAAASTNLLGTDMNGKEVAVTPSAIVNIGNGLTGTSNLDSTKLTGTISDAQLSANVAKFDGTNTWTGTNTFTKVIYVPSASIGTPNAGIVQSGAAFTAIQLFNNSIYFYGNNTFLGRVDNGNGFVANFNANPIGLSWANGSGGSLDLNVKRLSPTRMAVLSTTNLADLAMANAYIVTATITNSLTVFGTSSIPTNTAAYFTITNAPSVALATSWTNPCAGRIQLIVSGTLNMAVAGSTTLTFTNLTTSESYIVAGSTASIAGTSYFTDKELLSPGDVIQYIAANTGTATTTLTGTTIKKQ